MRYFLRIMVGVFVLGAIFYMGFCFELPEGRIAVVTRFGKPVRTVREAGLHIRWPYPIDDFFMFDGRKRLYNTKFTQTLTKDKRSIILLTYVVWQIQDPLVFLQSMGSIGNAEYKLESLISNSKNSVLGNYNLDALVSTDPSTLKFTEIEDRIMESVSERARESFGVHISRIGIKRLAFPENNISAIFEQMRAERSQFAAEYRAEGSEKSSNIRSNTDLEVARIKAEAIKKAGSIRGEADRIAAETYARAHEQGKEFYKLTRSLEALERMTGKNTVFVIRDDEPPFDVLKNKGEN